MRTAQQQLEAALTPHLLRRNALPTPATVTREVSIATVAAGQAFDLMAMRRQLDAEVDRKLVEALAHAEAALVVVQLVADGRRVRKAA